LSKLYESSVAFGNQRKKCCIKNESLGAEEEEEEAIMRARKRASSWKRETPVFSTKMLLKKASRSVEKLF